MTKRELAESYFLKGYTCAQAVVLAFAEEIGAEGEQLNVLLKVASSFGGGFGRLREVCGAVSGMGIVVGAMFGLDEPDNAKKTEHYRLIQRLAGEFKDINGSIVCRELLGAKLAATNPEPAERTPEYYKTRPCAKLVGDSAQILEKFCAECHT